MVAICGLSLSGIKPDADELVSYDNKGKDP